MKNSKLIIAVFLLFSACKPAADKDHHRTPITSLFENYYNYRMRLFPLEATMNGDNRFNDRLPLDISVAYHDTLRVFFQDYLARLQQYDTALLSANDLYSFRILERDLKMGMEGLQFKDHLMPVNQFWGLPLTFGQLGSGKGIQPFHSVKDYEDFLGRVNCFTVWCDTAIANMREGVKEGYVLPKVLIERMLPQLQAMVVSDVTKSIFYQPLMNFPDSLPAADRSRLDSLYRRAITEQIIPSYQKLHIFLRDEYLPHGRTGSGIGDLPGGKEWYNYLAHLWTTTDRNADQFFDLGMSEVKRLHSAMDSIRVLTGFKGDLKAFFKYLNTDKKFFPFRRPQDVLDSFQAIHTKMEPALTKLFDVNPRTKFEIRQTEKFREASSSAEYNQGAPDGSRPGVFYVPIPDATKFNTFGMEDLFLHEAIPGHHYQTSLQAENDSLPKFRRFNWYGAYGEGWALYAESLGKELGLYNDPYQYFAALSEEMHRAIRLVVDAGMHTKGWTREQAIQFSLENEGESEESITAEIERYMAIPGQALSYKTGQLKILELRARAEKELGSKFSIASFHDAVLDGGCLPLSLLEKKIDAWIAARKATAH